ncbi:MAG: HAD family hydrolase [Kiritimatiellae bacterium]|nr:HAD family hydrolase [Kiritimatiellia bacterium]
MTPTIRLLVFDFDGTALGGHEPYDRFPPDFVSFLDGLKARGIRWITNTTWGVEKQWGLMQRSGVKSRPAFLCGGTGQFLARVQRGRPVHEAGYEREIVRRHRRFRRRHAGRTRKILSGLLARDLVSHMSCDFDGELFVSYRASPGCADRVMELLKPLLNADAYYLWHPGRKTGNTLMPAHINKGDVIRELQARLGLGPEHTIVAGDASNDLAMFDSSIARCAVCPSNAEAVLRARVRTMGGIIATRAYSWGVIEGVEKCLAGERSCKMSRLSVSA